MAEDEHAITRRQFLRAAAVLLGPAAAPIRQTPGARFVGTVPLGNPGNLPAAPLGRLLGSSLDARLFTDLAAIDARSPQTVVTPADRVYVRTACPAAARDRRAWTIPFGGLVESPVEISRDALERDATTGGPYLMECAGNADPANFGLMSATTWDGPLLTAVLDRVRPAARAFRVLVRGVDDPGPALTSVPGASWIFSRDDLEHARLAVRLNGAPLPPDHGFPVRLIVPGWYGCACIKWVDRIELIPDEAPATTQMLEFAARTHQDPQARLARDFAPAVIDTAAMPIRVEKWIVAGRVEYRVVGIVWGGGTPTNALSIRFKTTEPWVKVDDCPLPASTLTWSVWTHTWRPKETGRYQIVLRVDDPSIRTRRLDLFFYVREIDVEDL